MDTFSTVNAALGLRHVLEDGVAALEGRLSNRERQTFVLQDLTGLFQEARRGVQMSEGPQLFVRQSDVSAIQAYSLVFKYLADAYQGTLANHIEAASTTLHKARLNENISDNDRRDTLDFLRQILTRIKQEDALALQREPSVIDLS